MTDSEEMLFALIENLQREDLTPLEEARGYRTLIEAQDLTQEEVSQAVGKSRPSITNALRLLNLPEDIQEMLERGEITAGHARTLLSFPTEEGMRLGAQKAKEGASVRRIPEPEGEGGGESEKGHPADRVLRRGGPAEPAARAAFGVMCGISVKASSLSDRGPK